MVVVQIAHKLRYGNRRLRQQHSNLNLILEEHSKTSCSTSFLEIKQTILLVIICWQPRTFIAQLVARAT